MNKNHDWLLIFTFSPVQGFIVSAKKTKDLFAGSYLLSFLTYKVLLNLKENLSGDIEIIYPILDYPSKDLHHLMVGNYPNRFVVLVKNKTETEIRKIIQKNKETYNREINCIIQKVKEDFIKPFLENLPQNPYIASQIGNLVSVTNQLEEQIKDYFQTFTVAKAVSAENLNTCKYRKEYETTEKILGGRKTFRNYKGWKDFTFYRKKEKDQTVCHFPDGCTTCGERLSLAIDWTQVNPDAEEEKKGKQKVKLKDIAEGERLCGLCYAKRRIGEIYLSNPEKNPMLVCLENDEESLAELKLLFTRFPSTHDIALSKEKLEFWTTFVELCKKNVFFSEHIESFLNRKIFEEFKDEGSYSYGINTFYRRKLESLIKPVLEKFNLTNRKDILKTPWSIAIEFLSTEHLERLKQRKKEKGEIGKEKLLEQYIGILRSIFETIKKHTGKDFEQEFNKPPYFGIMYSDGDNIGKILGGEKDFLKKEFNINFHKEFSKKLSEYAKSVAFELEKGTRCYPGFVKVIYAGGDDVFTFLYPSEITRALKVSSKRYKELLRCLLKEGKATTSAGVVLGHAKVSLKYLLKKTREAEKLAKDFFGRNVFVIKVISRSGEETTFGAKYHYGEDFHSLKLLEDVIEYYKKNAISSKLPYTLRKIALRYFPEEEKSNEKQNKENKEENSSIEKEQKNIEQLGNIAKTLLKRELKRKINLKEEEKKKLIEEIFKFFDYQISEHTKLNKEYSSDKNSQKEKFLSVGEILRNLGGMFYVARELSRWG